MKQQNTYIRITYCAIALLPTVLLFALLPTALVRAQIPELPVSGQQFSLSKLTGLINEVARFIIGVAPIFAVIFIVWGGITYMAAGPDPEKAQHARTRIKNAIIGTVIIFGVGVILSTISSILGRGTLQ